MKLKESFIFRYQSGSVTEKESYRLLEWLKESRENRITYVIFIEP